MPWHGSDVLKKHAGGRLEAKAGDRAGEEGGCSNGGSSQD